MLALGNGAPDIFSAISAINQPDDEKASLAVGALFGRWSGWWVGLRRGSLVPYNGKIWRVLYLANEPFERNWRILIWRLRRGYYSTDVASTGKLIFGDQRSNSQNAKLKLLPNFPVNMVLQLMLANNCLSVPLD